MEMWEILVPARDNDGDKISREHHQAWDRQVAAISGGLTILPPAKGQWTDDGGRMFRDAMIPVRLTATQAQMEEVISLTLSHYPDQHAVMAYRISDCVLVRERDDDSQ